MNARHLALAQSNVRTLTGGTAGHTAQPDPRGDFDEDSLICFKSYGSSPIFLRVFCLKIKVVG
ncbi:MAG: hypothetical protein ACREOO_11400 [bacterium]